MKITQPNAPGGRFPYQYFTTKVQIFGNHLFWPVGDRCTVFIWFWLFIFSISMCNFSSFMSFCSTFMFSLKCPSLCTFVLISNCKLVCIWNLNSLGLSKWSDFGLNLFGDSSELAFRFLRHMLDYCCLKQHWLGLFLNGR